MALNKSYPAFLALALLTGACVHGSVRMPAGLKPQAARNAYYVSAEAFRSAAFPAPPAPDSEAQKADVAAVLNWQERRTGAECAEAEAGFIVDFTSLWGDKSPFRSPLASEVKDFFSRLDADSGAGADLLKNRFGRPRPYVSYPEIQPCVKKSRSFSYPSGHASYARVFAAALSDLVPQRREEFIRKADAIALGRVIGGVHYPTDLEAGKKFGDAFHALLLGNPAYLRDLAELRRFLAE
ncbi:MAG TPA: phosphatase PAP2 family protein [Elusimicrobiales bacterium]|nr:phosphatase PAP2 family protein [Elusimicrobiales bacterium]